ncbi:uncharacterized protein LOC106075224 [Biomphalaria glabrata]|uniref:Uncharacterized protein LOC106075224 n=1 Tax=Biomphalaria glabrata TaxID=6526 RepID=A0A9W2ZBS7_BIOGL|nr:uncharacterized protein LOC106075224 [Biomphalaria glabrata]
MKFKKATPIVVSLLLALASLTTVVGSLPCDNPNPIEEKAYVGAYEIYFPDTQTNSFFQPAQCRWKILAYRNDYVINLEFSDVNLTHGDFLNSCSERITVYDGPDVTDLVLADFCGLRSPSIVTSSRETLVVFRSNESTVTTGRFRLKYKAIRDKVNDDDSSQVLRIAFGGFIGAVAFVIICSGAIQRYKYGRSNGPVFLFFGRHRVDTTAMASTAGSRHAGGCPSTRRRTANEPAPQEAESASLRNRVAGFFHCIVIKLYPGRLDSESSSSDSSGDSSSLHHGPRSSFRFGRRQASITSCSEATHVSQGRRGSSSNNYEFDPQVMPHLTMDGHESFGYSTIPVGNFTSDPSAVKPPTYEDSVNSVNPLYLQSSGQAFYNRAFDLKDEGQGTHEVFPPPPPYSEVNLQSGSDSLLGTRGNNCILEATRTPLTGEQSCNDRFLSTHSISQANAMTGDSLTPVSLTQENEQLDPVLRSGATCSAPVVVDVLQMSSIEKQNSFIAHDSTLSSKDHKTIDPVSNDELLHPNQTISSSAPMELFRRSGLISTLAIDRPTQSATQEMDPSKDPLGKKLELQTCSEQRADSIPKCSDTGTEQISLAPSFRQGDECVDQPHVSASASVNNSRQNELINSEINAITATSLPGDGLRIEDLDYSSREENV